MQRGQIRLLEDKNGDLILNYITEWRSRDLLKAWNENNIGQIELMKLFRDKISDILQVPIKLGAYIDRSSSLHLYGLYIDRDGLESQITRMKEDGYEKKSRTLNEFFIKTSGKDAGGLKGIVAAQMCAEFLGYGLNQAESTLEELGFNIDNFAYPKEWDSWPKYWDSEGDRNKLARVI